MLRLAALFTPPLMLMASSTIGLAQTAATRADIPIGQVVLPNGDVRYFVPVLLGDGKPVDAALDTGSFGLRVFKSVLTPDQYKATDIHRSRAFASGSRFNGVMARATVKIGGAKTKAPVTFHLIEGADCIETKPNCPISKVKPDEVRLAGDGFPGYGFNALLGISLRTAPIQNVATNPLRAMGDARWIIELPVPGDKAPGHLIINPTDAERGQFALVKLARQGDEGWADGALPGCVVDEATKRRYCGKTLLDTGSPGFEVDDAMAGGPSRWKPGTHVAFELEGADAPLSMSFDVDKQLTTRVVVRQPAHSQEARISAGTLPFLQYDVLYDAGAGTIGFKRRAPTGILKLQ